MQNSKGKIARKHQSWVVLLVAVLVGILSVAEAPACLNKGTIYEGQARDVHGQTTPAATLRGYLATNHLEEGRIMEAQLVNSTNFNERSDYAVALVYVGKAPEAVDLLRTLEKERPGSYSVAANLGTALELAGKNEEALHWIEEGIRRNPESHKGTEWLHAKILEAKIAEEKDPNYFKNHSVLELDPAKSSSEIMINGKSLSPRQVGEAILYQLQERLAFVKTTDPSVASLLVDYAAIEAATNTLESAKELMNMAIDYGYPPERLQPQIKLYDEKIKNLRSSDSNSVIFVMAILVLLAGFVLMLLYRLLRVLFSWMGGASSPPSVPS